MMYRFQQADWLTKQLKHALTLLLLAAPLFSAATETEQITSEQATAIQAIEQNAPSSVLLPYTAYYRMHHNGLSAEAKRSLVKNGDNQWQLSQKAKLFFIRVSEESQLKEHDGQLRPLFYNYENSISSRQNQQINFDWQNLTASDQTFRKPWQMPLLPEYTDQLSAQLQMRQALIDNRFADKLEQTILTKGKMKTFVLEIAGEEVLDTPAGKLNTIKLRRYRKDKPEDRDNAMLVWLAKDWNYLIVRLESRDEDELFMLELLNAQLAGKAVGA
ncbi:DUF3108 domain-containing protein [Spongiibacter sp. KMU-158]|uniref:DUF3108 domain-containing protein n=1 Tax=Spongiibacter pelagi TaxID=2760804 RepID=A0A927BZD3_9GAMM|nr:DUF3108 domain-containing protein [Spongiibacter pelagi]MBD2858388.1 DUF3108 domain-containing protein [Spongiibacter pelagi]